jgi:dTDP-4-amino-4,6-dideoxygalactose transaminase
VYNNLSPVFADVDDSLCLDLESIKSKLTKRSNPASVRLKKLNKPRRSSNRARKI